MRNDQLVVTTACTDPFWRWSRTRRKPSSTCPTAAAVHTQGDYAHMAWMKHFFDGTVSLHRQTDDAGNVVLSRQQALLATAFHNPLRDPVVLVRRDGTLELKDGFHRVHESLARGYKGRVWCVVLDMDADESDG